MTNRELIARLSQEDLDAEVVLTVDIQGMCELRPVGGTRIVGAQIGSDLRKKILLEPDRTIDEERFREQELAEMARRKERWDALPIDPVVVWLDGVGFEVLGAPIKP